jgi:hypothetical protein
MVVYTIAFALVSILVLSRIPWQKRDLIFADFVAFWSVGKLVIAGHLSQVYDLAAQASAQGSNLPGETTSPFFYPPTFLLLCIPLGLVSFHTALATFMILTGTTFIWATRRVARHAWLPALAFPATMFNFIAGQNGMLTAAIMGGGLTLLDRRPRTAGMLFGAMVIKPHLAVIIPIALVMQRRWQTLLYTALSASAICAASFLVLGWEVWQQFFTTGAETARYILENGRLPFFKLLSVFGFSMQEGVSLSVAYVAQAASAVGAIATFVWIQCRAPALAIQRSAIVVAGLLIPPYVLQYDMVLMAFPCLWLAMQWIERREIPTAEGLLVLATFLAPIVGILLLESFPVFLLLRWLWLFYLACATAVSTNRLLLEQCHA